MNIKNNKIKFDSSNRVDFVVINNMVKKKSRILDIGCDDGTLLNMLIDSKSVDGRGIEISSSKVNKCLAKGLSVVQGDADRDLVGYPDESFDYVVLSQTIQAMQDPYATLVELLRVGKKAIISIPNFGYWRVRTYLSIFGKMPVTPSLPQTWYNTENIHLCTIKDFIDTCEQLNFKIEQAVALDRKGKQISFAKSLWAANLIGEQAVFLLSKK
ncbi:methionine biosynthesis protein MetW [Hyphomicrobiales bacterium]|jgi:methionine biosynthesis protein MetW|nr:methionine biosynthesis protein MetW [Hyphomicrobiales bacterium]MDC3272453.1 methionine biosynthesis protein MetW [Hyphomicrobiales bacterium]|tara:strand:+ start:1059 stop:1697 length:639 start_codon:yes stop_codon:yes gene_type:complete